MGKLLILGEARLYSRAIFLFHPKPRARLLAMGYKAEMRKRKEDVLYIRPPRTAISNAVDRANNEPSFDHLQLTL